MPLAESYDTIGWFARDPAVMSGVAHVLFDDWHEPEILTRLYVPEDLWALADAAVQAALGCALDRLEELVGPQQGILIGEDFGPEPLVSAYMVLQGREAWHTHRGWIEAENPAFGPGIAERFRMISAIADDEVARWSGWRSDFADRLCGILTEGAVMALPTAPCIAPLVGEPQDRLADVRRRILMMTGAAGHAGLPEISIPFATVEGCPVGFSIVGRRGGDEVLLDLARRMGRG